MNTTDNEILGRDLPALVGAHYLAERSAGRQVPRAASVHPLDFWSAVNRNLAKVLNRGPGLGFDVPSAAVLDTAAGPVEIRADPRVAVGDVHYEYGTPESTTLDEILARAPQLRAAGVLELTVAGVSLKLGPVESEAPAPVEQSPSMDVNAPPLADGETFGYAPGTPAPGFKHRRKQEDD